MKLKALLRELDKYDPEANVIIASDEEGNSFGHVYQVSSETLEEVPGKVIILWPSSL